MMEDEKDALFEDCLFQLLVAMENLLDKFPNTRFLISGVDLDSEDEETTAFTRTFYQFQIDDKNEFENMVDLAYTLFEYAQKEREEKQKKELSEEEWQKIVIDKLIEDAQNKNNIN